MQPLSHGVLREAQCASSLHARAQSLHPLVAEVWKASERLAASGVLATPLLESRWLAEAPNGRHRPASVLLKLENRQVTGSFKARGATNKVIAIYSSSIVPPNAHRAAYDEGCYIFCWLHR